MVNGDAGRDDIGGGGGIDRFIVFNGDGSDDYDGGAGNDYYDARTLTGALIVDLLAGQARNADATDLLTSIERVFGGAGNDRIFGSSDVDLMYGGSDVDRFIFTDFEEFISI